MASLESYMHAYKKTVPKSSYKICKIEKLLRTSSRQLSFAVTLLSQAWVFGELFFSHSGGLRFFFVWNAVLPRAKFKCIVTPE